MGSRVDDKLEVLPGCTYCTLITNDGYVDAALVLAKSIRNTGSAYPLAAIITNSLSETSVVRMKKVFSDMIPVFPLSGIATKNLAVIGRPDLKETMTKLHLWSLTQYSRVLYLDADTLVLQNLDHLFERMPLDIKFAAGPELGFPDCFNAGMMFITPEGDTYRELLAFAKTHESFDGGDQGLLNVFFGDGAAGHPCNELLLDGDAGLGSPQVTAKSARRVRNWHRLSVTYNLEMHRVFRLNIPAALRYHERGMLRVVHFIGKDKPWHYENEEPSGEASPYFEFYKQMVRRWWNVRKGLDASLI